MHSYISHNILFCVKMLFGVYKVFHNMVHAFQVLHIFIEAMYESLYMKELCEILHNKLSWFNIFQAN